MPCLTYMINKNYQIMDDTSSIKFMWIIDFFYLFLKLMRIKCHHSNIGGNNLYFFFLNICEWFVKNKVWIPHIFFNSIGVRII